MTKSSCYDIFLANEDETSHKLKMLVLGIYLDYSTIRLLTVIPLDANCLQKCIVAIVMSHYIERYGLLTKISPMDKSTCMIEGDAKLLEENEWISFK
jgi:hypothetical protein